MGRVRETARGPLFSCRTLAADGPPLAGIDLAEEGVFDAQGKWQPGRRLNGDQTHQGRHIRLPPGKPQIQRVRLYRYR